MINIVKSGNRGTTNIDWLNSCHSFSFGGYLDYDNIQFGTIRVLNHDIVAPGAGFPTHPHKDFEIVTIMLRGELAHKDSTGTEGVIGINEVQHMTAGSGIEHSEFNNSETEEAELLQIWFFPKEKGLTPGYDQKKFDPAKWENNIALLVSGDLTNNDTINIQQDAELYRSKIDAGKELTFSPRTGKGQYLYLISGEIILNDENLWAGDAAKITGEESLEISAVSDSEFILFQVNMN